MNSRRFFTDFRDGGSLSNHSRVNRPAPRSRLSATSGLSVVPTDISREPPPMSRSQIRPADQPYQRRTARKVNRASSSPVRICKRTPVASSTASSTFSELFAERIADVANGNSSSQRNCSAISEASPTPSVSLSIHFELMFPFFERHSIHRMGDLQLLIGNVVRPNCVQL